MPSNCSTTVAAPYIPHHNPELYLADLDASTGLGYACNVSDVPIPASWPDPLPGFSLIVPDGCHDMHGSKTICPGGTDQIIRDGDTWLAQNVPTLLGLGAIVVVTFDEGTDTDTTGGGGHVPTIMAGPNVSTGAIDASLYTHDGLLGGLEGHFGLPLLGGAAGAAPLPIPLATSSASPTITGFDPATGKAGDQVTITGAGFTGAFSVRFNGVAAAFAVSDDSTIAATRPSRRGIRGHLGEDGSWHCHELGDVHGHLLPCSGGGIFRPDRRCGGNVHLDHRDALHRCHGDNLRGHCCCLFDRVRHPDHGAGPNGSGFGAGGCDVSGRDRDGSVGLLGHEGDLGQGS
jgi:hypothetical protein